MNAVAYTVRAHLPDEATADAYVAWLEDGHVDAVIRGGAHSAMIVRLDADSPGGRPCVEVRYVFSTRELLDRYFAEHAPALRAEGLRLFGPDKGVRMERTVGTIV
ncbi:MAG: DUF4286 family protein [Phycisphaerales bacterium]|nr:DUF4286 family protein [Phycisphaerales bacterium]